MIDGGHVPPYLMRRAPPRRHMRWQAGRTAAGQRGRSPLPSTPALFPSTSLVSRLALWQDFIPFCPSVITVIIIVFLFGFLDSRIRTSAICMTLVDFISCNHHGCVPAIKVMELYQTFSKLRSCPSGNSSALLQTAMSTMYVNSLSS